MLVGYLVSFLCQHWMKVDLIILIISTAEPMQNYLMTALKYTVWLKVIQPWQQVFEYVLQSS